MQSPLIDHLARLRIAELHVAASQERRLVERTARLPRTRIYAARMLIALGTRLAPTETRATNRVSKLVER